MSVKQNRTRLTTISITILAMGITPALVYAAALEPVVTHDALPGITTRALGMSPGVMTQAPPPCLLGVSKNLCNGRLSGGTWTRGDCVTPDGNVWTTLVGTQARLQVRVLNNPDLCDNFNTCDETPDVTGLLNAKVDFRIRFNRPCPVRGCWEGSFELVDDDVDPPVVIATGRLEATLGVGTHRSPVCLVPFGVKCGDNCERCYNAQRPTEDPGFWQIHVEGSIRGNVANAQPSSGALCTTFQGYFRAPAGEDGLPIPPDVASNGWFFCGTAEGVVEKPCIFPGNEK